MIDIQLIRDNPELKKEKSRQKGYDVDIDRLLSLDNERKELLTAVEDLRRRRNEIADSMKNSGGKPDDSQVEEGRRIKVELAEREGYLNETEASWRELLEAVPNPHFDDVPVGGEEDSAEISRSGDTETGARDHLELAAGKDWIDFERGGKVAGAKFYYLKNDLALLENALLQYALKFVTDRGFSYMTVPNLVNSSVARGAGFAPRSSEQSDEYFVEGEDLALIATAEIPLTGYHADEIISEENLPLLYAAYSPCYRKEAGTYGKHTRGLFRVHQFNKLEMYAFVKPEESAEMHEKMRALEEELWQSLSIPYRVINIASGDLGAPAAKKYDLEYWSKADGQYRELTSCSNCTDFQTRNLNIRLKRKDGKVEMMHSLNGTAVSMARSLIAIIEHYQTPEGDVIVPEPLRGYMFGKEKI